MRKLLWHLVDIKEVETRYCPNCGRVVPFKRTSKTRTNANGKNLYHFEIYKCPKDHSWNKRTDSKSLQDSANSKTEHRTDQLTFESDVLNKPIVITLVTVQGKWRLDKLLADNIQGVSRVKVTRWIKTGQVLVNDKTVKAKYLVAQSDKISIQIHTRGRS